MQASGSRTVVALHSTCRFDCTRKPSTCLPCRFLALQSVLGCSPVRLAKAIRSQPSLLGYFPATLAHNIASLASLLSIPLEQAQVGAELGACFDA